MREQSISGTFFHIAFFSLYRASVPALLFACIVLANASSLFAQGETGRSYIVRVAPGVEVKAVAERIVPLLPVSSSSVSVRPAIISAGSDRSLLSARRLDRYLVVEFGGGDGKEKEGEEGKNTEAKGREGIRSTLLELPGVEAVFPNHLYRVHEATPNDTRYGEQWALRKIEATEAWEITEGSADVLVGVIDTGIEWDHPDLKNALWINGAEDLNGNGRFDPWPSDEIREGVSGDLDGIDQDGNGYADDLIGYDFVDQDVPNIGDWNGRDGVPGDDQGHGTNVSGVIGAQKNNGTGIAGIAPGTRLVTLRAFDGTGNGQDDDIAAAIVYAADRGVSVLNMSFGDFYNSPLMYDAVRYAYDKGVLLVGSSGNNGIPDPHYPSAFAEVTSVGATDSTDLVSFFSTYGSQLALVAPGVKVLTTDGAADYKTVDGTSFAAPYVAGVAALMRSIHPDWSGDEVIAAIESTTDDLGAPGWDENFGAGRLNAAAALRAPGPALLAVTEPKMDGGIDRDGVVDVYGSAVAPLLQSWRLEVGEGNLPEEWSPVAESNEGILDGLLGSFSTTPFADTLLNLRLTLTLTNGRTLERRTRFFLDRTPPTAKGFRLRNIWRFERRALAVTFRTDDLTRGILHVRPAAEPDAPYLSIELEPERVGFTREHYYYLTGLELAPGVPYDLYVELVNGGGGRTLIGGPDAPLSAMIEQASFPVGTMERMEWTLPYSFVLNEKLRLTGDAPEILLNRLDGFSFERMFLYRFQENRFVPVDSAGNWIPRGVGDSDGDGLAEVLGQSSRTGIVYEQTTPGGSPFASVMFADSVSGRFYPGGFYELDDDGRDELIGYTSEQDSTEQFYFTAAWNGSGYAEQARLPNVTLPEPGFSRNFMGASDVVVADFNNNGRPDILFGDEDADFMIYERESAGSYKLLWAKENDGEEGDRMIAAGDLDNDGIPEAILAYRSPGSADFDHEYAPPFWTLLVVSLKDGGAVVTASEEFAYVRSSSPFRPGIEAGDLDGKPGDEIALSVFPNMYVLRWDASPGRLRPFWWRNNSLINRPIIQDFNEDGVNELGTGDGEVISFFQADPETEAPEPPAGAQGWALDDSAAYVEWEPVAGADRYFIYRALIEDSGPITFLRIAETDSIRFVDSSGTVPGGRLRPNRTYGYIVTAVDDGAADPESGGSRQVLVFTHAPVRIVKAEAVNAREVRVEMSGPVDEKLYRSGALLVRRSGDGTLLPVSSVLSVGERTVLLALMEEEYDAELAIRPTRLFRDFFGTPADTSVVASVTMPPRRNQPVFIATRAEPADGNTIAVEFADPVDPVSGTDPANYRLDPPGEIVGISVDPADPRRLLLRPEESYRLGPYGYEYLVTIRDVLSADGRTITTGAGSTVGFTISADDLESLLVYPHPFSLGRDNEVTFAGLTQRARIRIYTPSGALLREIESVAGDGGAAWDGTDMKGREVPTGVYLYSVIVTDARGTERESRLRKIAVVP